MANTWRVILDESLPGIENMARDAAILAETEKLDSPMTTLRFYRWIIPTLSIGNKQDARKCVDLEYCRKNGIDLVRRPTGGGAVLHHLELTYSIISNDVDYFPNPNIMETYRLIAGALARGLESLGIASDLVEHEISDQERSRNYIQNPVPCFSLPSNFEISVKGRKIIGSAQKRLKTAFLQHGSIPYQFDWNMQAGAMHADPTRLKEAMTCIGEHISPLPGYRQLVEAFVQGFADVFHAKLAVDNFTGEEMDICSTLMDEFKINY